MENDPFIDFNMDKVQELKASYEESIEFILSELPAINWNSSQQAKKYFKEHLDITLENVKIDHVLSHLESVSHDSPAFDVINGFVLYLKQKFTLKNYIDCICRHQINGRVTLRLFGGRWVLPNRQPVSSNPEITECVIAPKESNNGFKV